MVIIDTIIIYHNTLLMGLLRFSKLQIVNDSQIFNRMRNLELMRCRFFHSVLFRCRMHIGLKMRNVFRRARITPAIRYLFDAIVFNDKIFYRLSYT